MAFRIHANNPFQRVPVLHTTPEAALHALWTEAMTSAEWRNIIGCAERRAELAEPDWARSSRELDTAVMLRR